MATTTAIVASPRPRRTVVVGVPRPTAAVAVLAAVVVAAVGGGGVYAKLTSTRPAACTLSEFACSSSSSTADEDDDDANTAATADVSCVPSIKYCDGRRDCPDGSDEPHYCTREFNKRFINIYFYLMSSDSLKHQVKDLIQI